MLSTASLNGLSFDTNDLKTAEKKILFATFHDILPGTCVEEGEKEGLCALSMAEKIVRDYRTKVFLRMSMNQKHAEAGEFPVFVFNYAPYEVVAPVEVEFMLENQNWNEEVRYVPHVYCRREEIPCQTIKEDKKFVNVSLDGNVVLTNCRHNAKGEYIARIYNPDEDTETFRLTIGDVAVEGKADKGEVVSIVVKDGKGDVVHDKMPV